MNSPSSNGPGLDELLADEAAGALSEAERHQIEPLLREVPAATREAFLRTASLVQLSCLEQDRGNIRRMPDRLRARLLEQGHQAVARQAARPVTDIGAARERRRAASPPADPAHEGRAQGSGTGRAAALGGWAVAACLAVALAANLLAPGPGGEAADPARSRAAMLADAASVALPWSGGDERYADVSGDVVWNDQAQSGFLRLVGMPVNDPGRAQYQLWIIDPDRDSRPVDGGVFDVTSSGEVIIPVQARLAVDRPTTFAITLEKPGGVVVSAGPLLVVASAG
jgi:anti-sigma-K factor RskA